MIHIKNINPVLNILVEKLLLMNEVEFKSVNNKKKARFDVNSVTHTSIQ